MRDPPPPPPPLKRWRRCVIRRDVPIVMLRIRRRVCLQRPPAGDGVRAIAVDLEPGQRLIEDRAAQQAALRARAGAQGEEPRLRPPPGFGCMASAPHGLPPASPQPPGCCGS